MASSEIESKKSKQLDGSPPKVTVDKSQIAVTHGEPLRIECKVETQDPAYISMKRNGEQLMFWNSV